MASRPPSSVINVLIIAHPDDESMFFVPLLFSLKSQSNNTWIICLTTGDYDGLGATRTMELQSAVRGLLLLSSTTRDDNNAAMIQLRQLHRPDQFPDHPRQKWDIPVVADALEETLRDIIVVSRTSSSSSSSNADDEEPQRLRLFTFDEDGVSGHWNHRDTYFAVRHVVQRATHCSNSSSSTTTNSTISRLPIESAWCLRTVRNPIQKYFPVFEWIRLLLSLLLGVSSSWEGQRHTNDDREDVVTAAHDADDDDDELVYRLLRPMRNWQLMRTHRSQFVWYRRLFIMVSCYTYCNRFRRIIVVTTTKA
jgi:N-acetylglucosaminylphosphatidylinositol deacetylase